MNESHSGSVWTLLVYSINMLPPKIYNFIQIQRQKQVSIVEKSIS